MHHRQDNSALGKGGEHVYCSWCSHAVLTISPWLDQRLLRNGIFDALQELHLMHVFVLVQHPACVCRTSNCTPACRSAQVKLTYIASNDSNQYIAGSSSEPHSA